MIGIVVRLGVQSPGMANNDRDEDRGTNRGEKGASVTVQVLRRRVAGCFPDFRGFRVLSQSLTELLDPFYMPLLIPYIQTLRIPCY